MSDLAPIPGGWTEQIVDVGHASIRLVVPADPDAVLDDAADGDPQHANEFTPYWSWLWPAAQKMARLVARLPDAVVDQPALEVGCGIGLVGISAAMNGWNMVLSDYSSDAVAVARHNAELNGIPNPDVRQIDWRVEPQERFRTVLACDVLYEPNDHAPLLQFLKRVLESPGECWIGDPGRQRAGEFIAAASNDFQVRLYDADLQETSQPVANEFLFIRVTNGR